MVRKVEKKTIKKAIKKVVKKVIAPKSTRLEDVKRLIDGANKTAMYDWLVGLDSPGPTPRDAGYYRLLYLLAKEFKMKYMADLGTCEGVSAMCMAKGNPEGFVYSLDIVNKLDSRCAQSNVAYIYEDAVLLSSDSDYDFLDLLFIDVEHEPASMEKAFKAWEKYLLKDSVILFDGVSWNKRPQMWEWWASFTPEGYHKLYSLELHSLEDAGMGILIKK